MMAKSTFVSVVALLAVAAMVAANPEVEHLTYKVAHVFANSLSKTAELESFEPMADVTRQFISNILDKQPRSCLGCKQTVKSVQQRFLDPANQAKLNELAKTICISFNLFTQHVCNGTVDLFDGPVLTIIGHSVLEPTEVCGLRGECPYTPVPTWEPTFAKPKPTVPPRPVPSPDGQRQYILHITDTHYDPSYVAGAEAKCIDPLCCRPPWISGNITKPAGIFGDYLCDAPLTLVNELLDHAARSRYPISSILWTGDIPPHDVWESNRESYRDLMQLMASRIQNYFPRVPVFGAIGNHESVPVDLFAPNSIPEDEFSARWLYETLANQWSRWLPESAVADLRKRGSYTALVSRGLRVVSINDEGCSEGNWWLRMRREADCCKFEVPDPDLTLKWLVDTLQAAEDAGEKVLFLRHIPNSSRCNKEWSLNFHKILDRFESTLIAMFTGHSHDDEFEIHYRGEGRAEPFLMNYIGPGMTPYTNGNPAYRIYELDVETQQIVNHYTYIMNLEESNRSGRAVFFEEYDAVSAYSMRGLHAEDWNELTQRFEADDALFQKWYLYYGRSIPGRTCDEACKARSICEMRTARTEFAC
eukprot:TRINITY_DN596_c0_g2_i1.p1 TRINITY_DN596_c0_g2~~TRINITY_DN596_c0_g2_i1.p1  ORF type:complete len:589 (-),score=93.33 TRINITY_DN596_c0_g2_i1:141-1907(-)